MQKRIIKFRAWDKVNKKMIDWSWFLNNEVCEMFDNEDLEVMQYTELKDKNVKEIYEGDILKDTKHGRYIRTFKVNDIRTITREFDKSEHNSEWEIIGNIFENKNLIK